MKKVLNKKWILFPFLLALLGVFMFTSGFGQDQNQNTDEVSFEETGEITAECSKGCKTVVFTFTSTDNGVRIHPDYFVVVNDDTGEAYGGLEKRDLVYAEPLRIELPYGKYRFVAKAVGFELPLGHEKPFTVREEMPDQFHYGLRMKPENGRIETENLRALAKSKKVEGFDVRVGIIRTPAGEPIEGVRVAVDEYTYPAETFTDENGYYELYVQVDPDFGYTVRPYGSESPVVFEKRGYKSESFPSQVNNSYGGGHMIILPITDPPPSKSQTPLKKLRPLKTGFSFGLRMMISGCTGYETIDVGYNALNENDKYSCQDFGNYDFEEVYLPNVLSHEWIPSWADHDDGIESLKAGAVAIRSKAAYRIDNPLTGNYDICNTIACQVFPVSSVGIVNENNIEAVAYEAVQLTQDWYITDSSGNPRNAEYAAETNDFPTGSGYPQTNGNWWGHCGDGHFQKSVSGPPANNGGCYPDIFGMPTAVDYVSLGRYHSGSHPRALSQRGSARWATGLQVSDNNNVNEDDVILPANYDLLTYTKKDWKQILAWYYPYYELRNCFTSEYYDLDCGDIPCGTTVFNCANVTDDFPDQNQNAHDLTSLFDFMVTGSASVCNSFTPGDEDWLRLDLSNPGLLKIEMSGGYNPMRVSVFNVYNQRLVTSEVVGSSGSILELEVCTSDNGVFCYMCSELYIAVQSDYGPPVPGGDFEYTMKITWTPNENCSTTLPEDFSGNGNQSEAMRFVSVDPLAVSVSCLGEGNSADVLLSASGGSGNYLWETDDGTFTGNYIVTDISNTSVVCTAIPAEGDLCNAPEVVNVSIAYGMCGVANTLPDIEVNVVSISNYDIETDQDVDITFTVCNNSAVACDGDVINQFKLNNRLFPWVG